MVTGVPPQKPTLYAGRQVPFHELEWQDFERFVRTILIKLGARLGVAEFSHSAGAGDGGFDVFAKCADGSLAIFQCKRLTSKSVGLALAGEELAKVALSSKLEGSRISKHFIITCGSVGEELRSVLRGPDRAPLVTWARKKSVDGPDEVKALAARVSAMTHDPAGVAESYVRGIGDITVWSGTDLDAEIATISSALASEFERFFVVSPVLKEHPRPDLDEQAYLERVIRAASSSIELHCVRASSPPNLSRSSRARPSVATPATNASSATTPIGSLFAATKAHQAIALVGDGGAGKTTAAHLAAGHLAQARRQDSSKPIPIVVNGKSYAGSLDKLIHARLGVAHGNWRSLTGPTMIVLDGLDEIAPQHLAAVEDELETLPWDRCSVVVSLRHGGLRSPLVITRLADVQRLLPPSPHLARKLAAGALPPESVSPFVDALQKQSARRRDFFFETPFGLILAAEVFREAKVLPSSRRELVGKFVEARIARNRETARASLGSMSELPSTTLLEIAGEVAFQFMFVRERRELSEADALAAITEAMKNCRTRRVFGADDLRAIDVPAMLSHFEFLISTASGFALPHDVVAGFLASSCLAREWASRKADAGANFEDAWTFAAPLLETSARAEFIAAVASVSVIVAADCACEAGDTERKQVEALAVRDLNAKQLKRRRAAIALGRLGSNAALKALRDGLPSDPDEDRETFEALAGPLIAAGDAALANAVLDLAEKMSSTPGVTFSGGEAALWELTPSEIALTLARRRVDDARNGPQVFLSLDTIAAFGDADDIERLTRLSAHQDVYVVGHALRALYYVAPDDARQVATSCWARCTDAAKALLADLYAKVVGQPDASWCLRILEATTPFEPEDDALEQKIRASASAGIQASVLAPTDVDRLLRAFSTRCAANAPWLWTALGGRGLPAVDVAATEAVSLPVPHEIGLACIHVSRAVHWSNSETQVFRAALVRWLDADCLRVATWHGHQALDFLIDKGASAEAAGLLERAWKKLAATGNGLDSPMEFHLLLQFAGRLAEHLEHATLLALLGFDDGVLAASVREVRRALAAHATSDELDRILTQTESPAEFLAVLSTFGFRPRLGEALRSSLVRAVPYDHAALDALSVAVAAWFCDDVLGIVVDALSGADCRSPDGIERAFLRKLVDAVGARITRDQFERLVGPKRAVTKDAVILDVFDWWDEISAARIQRDAGVPH